jgi:NAD(P)-dependent dehydrogenase (short-subunit alcohol dehydrogenase family)
MRAQGTRHSQLIWARNQGCYRAQSYVLGPLHLVTGGSRGIGAAIAQRFLDAGAKVVVGIAEVVALLVSDRGKFLTGANYGVDGGMTAR